MFPRARPHAPSSHTCESVLRRQSYTSKVARNIKPIMARVARDALLALHYKCHRPWHQTQLSHMRQEEDTESSTRRGHRPKRRARAPPQEPPGSKSLTKRALLIGEQSSLAPKPVKWPHLRLGVCLVRPSPSGGDSIRNIRLWAHKQTTLAPRPAKWPYLRLGV